MTGIATKVAVVFLFLLGLHTVASPATIRIPQDYSTIQAGINAASQGDVVLVFSDSVNGGPYVENINFYGKAIYVRSESGAYATTIDGNQVGSVVTFNSGEGSNTVLDGFTVTNGSASVGAGINCRDASPTVTNNVITGNTANIEGGGVYCLLSTITISNNIISGNYGGSQGGGGIYCGGNSPTISNNIITNNSVSQWGGGICCAYHSAPTITNNFIFGNSSSWRAGGVYCISNSSSLIITNNTISGNSAGTSGGGVHFDYSSPVVTNNIIWGNAAPGSPEIAVGGSGNPTITFCNVKGGWSGTGNIDADPLFADPDNGDFHISSSSPCVDTGDNAAPQLPSIDFDGDPRVLDGDGDSVAVVDMGADELLPIYVPGDYGTIQEAIDAASEGAGIIVSPGTYVENINFRGKAITVRSASGVGATTINGNQAGSVVTFNSGEGSNTVLDGFTVTNGSASIGAGIYCRDASPTVTNNVITGNTADVEGGAVYCFLSTITISNNIISGNYGGSQGGGGIYCGSDSPTISNNIITNNSVSQWGGGICCAYQSAPTITNNFIFGNSSSWRAGGVYCISNSSSLIITNNTISGNSASTSGGGVYFNYSSPVVTNNIIWGNDAPDSPEIAVGGSGNPTITFCDVKGGWSGTGNIDADPLFADPGNADFGLDAGSLCIDAGDNTATSVLYDRDGNPRFVDDPGMYDTGNGSSPFIDMGCYEFQGDSSGVPVLITLPRPLVAGQTGTFIVTNADSNTNAYLGFSTVGLGSTWIPSLNVTVDLANPKAVGGVRTTNSSGRAQWDLQIHGQASGMYVWFQSVQYGLKTNAAATNIE
jgi:hypothetical protein